MTEEDEAIEHAEIMEECKQRMIQIGRADAGLYAIAYAIHRLSNQAEKLTQAIEVVSDNVEGLVNSFDLVITEPTAGGGCVIRTLDVGRE